MTTHRPNRVLVVDDDPIFLRLMGVYLTRLDCAFFPAATGREAIELVKRQDIDFCFMDILLGDTNGLEVARVIHEELKKPIPIVAVTAFYMKVDQDQCRAAGMLDVLRKPICFEDVTSTLAHYLKQ
ncbi:MAG: response regulator [Candidatus Omnitrophica bacterium]|nr:response regulator [Candidatus Omnitrophota bacterium]